MHKSNSFNVLAVVLIILGLILILDTFDIVPGIILLWPILVLVMGIGFCLLFYQKKRTDLVLLGMGSFLTMISLFFVYLNSIGWRSLAWLWPVFPAVLGASFLPPFAVSKRRALLYVGVLLMAVGAAFILIFSISTQLWPLSLIIAGVSFLILGKYATKKGAGYKKKRK